MGGLDERSLTDIALKESFGRKLCKEIDLNSRFQGAGFHKILASDLFKTMWSLISPNGK